METSSNNQPVENCPKRLADLKRPEDFKKREIPTITNIHPKEEIQTLANDEIELADFTWSLDDPDARKFIIRIVAAACFAIASFMSMGTMTAKSRGVIRDGDGANLRTQKMLHSNFQREMKDCISDGIKMGFTRDVAQEICGGR